MSLDKGYLNTNEQTTPEIMTREELTRQERGELRAAMMGEKAQHALEFQNKACLEFGPAAGIMARELLFWEQRGVDKYGWVYKTEAELEGIGLSRHNQRKARKVLVAKGVLEQDRRGVPARLWFRLDLQRLMELLGPHLQPEANNAPSVNHNYSSANKGVGLVRQSSVSDKSGNLESRTITERTQKELSEVRGVSSPDGSPLNTNEFNLGLQKEHSTNGATTQPAKDDVSSAETKPYNARVVVDVFEDNLSRLGGDPITEDERGRYLREFKEVIQQIEKAEGRKDAQVEMTRVIFRMFLRRLAYRNPYPLSPKMAYRDVRNGEQTPLNFDGLQKALQEPLSDTPRSSLAASERGSNGYPEGYQSGLEERTEPRYKYELEYGTTVKVYEFRMGSGWVWNMNGENWPQVKLLQSAVELLKDENTNTGRVFAGFKQGKHTPEGPLTFDNVLTVLDSDLLDRGYEDGLPADLHADARRIAQGLAGIR